MFFLFCSYFWNSSSEIGWISGSSEELPEPQLTTKKADKTSKKERSNFI